MTMQMKPLFSVVIPLYNKRAHIQRTIDSVLGQTCQDFELVIVDDGSTDGGMELIEMHYQSLLKAERRIRLIYQENAGVSVARNTGVQLSNGEIVAFLDADDTWEPHFLDEIRQLNKQFPSAGAFGTNYQFIVNGNTYSDPKIRFKSAPLVPRVLHDFFEVGARGDLPFMMSSFCIKKNIFEDVGGFPVGEAMGEDQDLFCRTALASEIAYSPSVLSFYHHDAENRACERHIPSQACGFADRLRTLASKETKSKAKREMMNYVASHLLHLASLNVKSKRPHVARQLLSDQVCKLQYPRYLWWRFRCLVDQ